MSPDPDAPESSNADPTPPEAALSGSGLAAEKARRLAQVDAIRDAGGNPYPYRFDRTHTVGQIRAAWG